MDHQVTGAPPLVTEPPDEGEALRLAVGRVMLAVLRAAKVRGMSPAEAAERLEQVAQIFEKEVARHAQ